MGTRSTVKFYNEHQFICGIYIQYDGYVEGVGKDIYDILKDGILVNGINIMETRKVFNGMLDLSAMVICKLKKEKTGNVYMTFENDSQEYNYKIYNKNNFICIDIIDDDNELLFSGKVNDMIELFEKGE